MFKPNPPILIVQCENCNKDLPGAFGLPESVTTLIYASMCKTCNVPVIVYKPAHDRLLTIFETLQMEKAAVAIAKIHYPSCQWWIDRIVCEVGAECKHPRWHVRAV